MAFPHPDNRVYHNNPQQGAYTAAVQNEENRLAMERAARNREADAAYLQAHNERMAEQARHERRQQEAARQREEARRREAAQRKAQKAAKAKAAKAKGKSGAAEGDFSWGAAVLGGFGGAMLAAGPMGLEEGAIWVVAAICAVVMGRFWEAILALGIIGALIYAFAGG